jgi:hypothetical protein
VTAAGVIPDVDGFGLLVDGANAWLGRPATFYFSAYHHALLHGLLGAALVAATAAALTRRLSTTILAVVAFHAHLLCDVVGSRGPDPEDLWSIRYFAPISDAGTFAWSGQWRLDGAPNILLTVFLLGVLFVRANRRGYSPVVLISPSADRSFVEAVRARWRSLSR